MGSEVVKAKYLGGSLPVENVQALASASNNYLKDIPPRYIRPEVDDLNQVLVDQSTHIPVIDMSKLSGDQLGYDHELAKLHQACKQWGFFQLINHGASTEAIEKMKEVIEDFFKLPLEEKMVYAQLPNCLEGYGQAFVLSEDQKLDWGDMFFLVSLPVSLRNMRFWPNTPTSFRSAFNEYTSELHKVAMKLFSLIGKNLGIDPEKLRSMYENGVQSVRMNYYPPCVHPDKVMGISPHSDATGLTLLVQVNQVQGLQINKNQIWVPIEPVTGSIIVNIGDIMEIMSNGEYRSIEHRGVVNVDKERLSMATFHSPNDHTEIGPLIELVKENGANYKALNHMDYYKLIINSKLDGKSLLDLMKI